MNAIHLLAHCPLIAPEEAAKGMGVDVATIRRNFKALRDSGLATYHLVGRDGHLEQRWVLTREGVTSLYPDERDAPWWLTESGLKALLRRVQQLRAIYRSLLNFFEKAGRDWVGKSAPPRLESCQYIRGPRTSGAGKPRETSLIQAMFTYSGGITIFICWVGREHRVPEIIEKWKLRFHDLLTDSLDGYCERTRDHLIEPPDPEFDATPRPSGYVVIGDGKWAVLSAHWSLPRDGYHGEPQPFAFIDAETNEGWCEDVIVPRPHDTVQDHPDEARSPVGNPLRVIRPDKGPHPEDFLGNVVPSRILDLAQEWHGLRVRDLGQLLRRSRKEVQEAVDRMVQDQWLQEVEGMLYLGRQGVLHVAARDRVSPGLVRTRVDNAIKQDHKKVGSQKRHTIAVNETMVRHYKVGVTLYAGWRATMDLRSTQLAPDLVIVLETALGTRIYCIEVERTAKYPEQVSDKIHPYGAAFVNGELTGMAGKVAGVFFIVELPAAEDLFQRLSQGLPVLTTTLGDIRRGPLRGRKTVFRFEGAPIALP